MNYNESYEIGLLINETDTNVYPTGFSFIMSDSIYSMFPKCKLFFNDSEGVFQELLFSTEGMKLGLTLGYKDNYLKNNYCINSDQLTKNISKGRTNGVIEIHLDHYIKYNQAQKIRYYQDMASKVVQKIISDYTFSKVVINDSGSTDDYYQPNIFDFDFIENFLLPVMYSNNSSESPFYCFINNNNEFHLRNYLAMMDGKPSIELKQFEGNLANLSPYSFSDITRFRTGSDYTYDKRHRKIYSIGEDNTINKLEDYINSYPNKEYGNIPIIGTKDNVTGTIELLDDESTAGKKEINKGIKIQSMRSSFGMERFLLSFTLSPFLIAGKNVKVTIYDSTSLDKTKASVNYSGEYLIERSFHKWDGNTTTPSTQIVVSRKTIPALPTSIYKLKDQLLK